MLNKSKTAVGINQIPCSFVYSIRGLTMNNDQELFINQLKAIIACDQSDGILKKWAGHQLSRLEARNKSPLSRLKKTLSHNINHLPAMH
jgi:hypothetical protein